MARARNVKPSFFKNELLGQGDPLISLLFISLWTLADKAGRLEDRPLRIKAETFPYRENVEVERYLTELVSLGFIERYKVGELSVIQIINFTKHQTPHSTEKNSELPCKPEPEPTTVNVPLVNGSDAVNGHINVLNPDSLLLNPSNTMSPQDEKPPVGDRVPYAEIVKIYHETLPQLPKVMMLTAKRKAQIAARWKSGVLPDLETWKDYFTMVSHSPFLMGLVAPTDGRKRFVADLEWLTNESHFTKVWERKYHGT